ncbi:hypothetical protein Q4F19_16910 [Sphingomonas sp. BIUV-7]|uniref:Chain length determinant protein tyrosine kinase EpsG n=1 Tax=Sphingomonas natans TaxID=3063330 RepID=A0ABT8YCJ5_9SPHN|nr:hypothetical protein [Sphingomonas sp. BIUV-7]MDO6416071.1 hypothetical protein [Sphingomonas sp. BIUV-7]
MNDPLSHGRFARLRIGEILIAQGKLTPDQASEVAKRGVESKMLFGEAAVSLGFVSERDISQAIDLRETPSGPRARPHRDRIAILDRPHSRMATDLKRLAKALAVRWFADTPRQPALSVISAQPSEGRTTLAVNLACIFAMGGARTLLVDGDLENPQLHSFFDLGQADVSDHASAHQVAPIYYAVDSIDQLAIMPANELTKLGGGDLMALPLHRIIELNADRFDTIFVDTSAASRSNDFLLAAQATRGALVVSRGGITRTRPTIKMLDACDDAGIKIVGGTMIAD